MKTNLFGQIYCKSTQLCTALMLTILVLTFISQAVAGEQLQGAAVVLKKINDEFTKDTKESVFSSKQARDKKSNDIADIEGDIEERLQLVADLEKYEKKKKTMNAEKAASKWFEIAQRFLAFDQMSAENCLAAGTSNCRRLQKTFHLSSIIKVLPGPNSWKYLADKFNANLSQQTELPEGFHAISMFLHLLNTDIPSAYRSLDTLEEKLKKKNASFSGGYFSEVFDEARQEIKRFADKDEAINEVHQFKEAINRHSQDGTKSEIITVPDLISYTDSEEAREMLQSALLLPSMYLTIPVGNQTRVLAEEIILRQSEVFTRPQWGLVYSSKTYEMFEKIERKHSKPLTGILSVLARVILEDKHNRTAIEAELKPRAVSFYHIDNLKKNNLSKAVEYAQEMSSSELSSKGLWEVLKEIGRADLYPVYFEFLQGLLVQKPKLSFWEQYVKLGLVLDRSEECLETIDAAFLQNSVSFLQRLELKKNQIDIHLAQDRIEDALPLIFDIVNLSDTGLSKNVKTGLVEKKFDIAIKLIRLGQILKREDLLDKGFSWSRAVLDELYKQKNDGFFPSYKVSKVAKLLVENGRYREAEELIVNNCLLEVSQMDPNSLMLHT